jgi:membrane protein YqaA with SNARE-associated domain
MMLFLLSLITSTPIPFPYDLAVIGYLKNGVTPLYVCILATIGLTLAAIIDYLIGKYGIQSIPFLRKNKKTKRFRQAKKMYERYGQWTLLFTFIPFVGKYFPFLAGIMELSFVRFFLILVAGKLIYYGLLVLVVCHLL